MVLVVEGRTVRKDEGCETCIGFGARAFLAVCKIALWDLLFAVEALRKSHKRKHPRECHNMSLPFHIGVPFVRFSVSWGVPGFRSSKPWCRYNLRDYVFESMVP